MVLFFKDNFNVVFAVESTNPPTESEIIKQEWLYKAKKLNLTEIKSCYIGPKKTMVSPWSTNAVEITQNMGIEGIERIEKFRLKESLDNDYDPMIFEEYSNLNQDLFKVSITPQPILEIENISEYNIQEGLALNEEEINYLENLSKKLSRKLTDSEVFGFSQVNSEHCRHKIFNGEFIIDGKKKRKFFISINKKNITN